MADVKREQLITYAKAIHDYCLAKCNDTCGGCPFEWEGTCLLVDTYGDEIYSPADWCLDK